MTLLPCQEQRPTEASKCQPRSRREMDSLLSDRGELSVRFALGNAAGLVDAGALLYR